MNILFVCKYNRGRSQIAAAFFNQHAKSGHADSAGTQAETAGDTLAKRAEVSPGARNVLNVMTEKGHDLSQNTQDQLTEEMPDNYDKVVVMAEQDSIPDYLKDSDKFVYWPIEDPAQKTIEDTRQTRDLIEQKVLDLINES